MSSVNSNHIPGHTDLPIATTISLKYHAQSVDIPQYLCCLFVISFCSLWFCTTSHAQTVELPITLENKILTTLLKDSYFKDSNETARLVAGDNPCTQLILSHPALEKREPYLNFSARILLHLGTKMGSECFTPIEWEGFIDVVQRPQISTETWELSFETMDVIVSTADRKPVLGADQLWKRISPEVEGFMSNFKINLAPPVADLRSFLLPLFSTNMRREAKIMLDSLRPGSIIIGEGGITVTILAEIQEAAKPHAEEGDLILSDRELEKTVALWEMWDAFFVHLITTLSSQALTEEEKDTLVTLLLKIRYTFVDEIQQHTIGRDFVREQFVDTWQQLSPIFKNHFLLNPENSVLGYLSFTTAADALAALDNLGPSLGIEISRNGLLRLIKILHADSEILDYSPVVNTTLQELFDSKPPPPAPITTPEVQPHLMLKSPFNLEYLYSFFWSSAYAATPSFMEIKKWQTPKNGIDEYLLRVRSMLDTASIALLAREGVAEDIHNLYRTLITAIAWQESCFRQFVVRKNKLTYLLSYNNSSVGIMQINERVWRGVYDRNRLRWDIRYNAFAGCEIANLYLQKYVLPKSPSRLLKNKGELANIVYAMYNGGPSQYRKYLQRNKEKDFYKSDKLFRQKYSWVTTEKWHKIDICL